MDVNKLQHLHDQYVVVIQNEGDWYRQATLVLGQGRIARFKELTVSWIWNTRRLHQPNDSMCQAGILYITMKLYDGLLEDQAVPGLHRHPYPAEWMNLKMSIESAIHKLNKVQQKFETAVQETKEKNAMSNIPFTTKNYVFGQDVETMTEEQLIAALKKVEGEIENLKAVKTKSKKIDAMVKDAEAGLEKIVAVLDSK